MRPVLVLALAAALTVVTVPAASGDVSEPASGPAPAGTATRLPHAYGVLGANYNQNLDSVDFGELRTARASWLRGFFVMPWADEGDPADHFAVRTLRTAGQRGYGTLLSLKFPFYRTPFPEPGSEAMAAELARLDKLLPTVMGTVDIITIGNEPFIESRRDDRGEALNVFYETVARHVIAYREAHCGPRCKTRLYMGALNRLDLPGRRTPAVERWMSFVRDTPQIDGVDIHIHAPDPRRSQAFLDYILPRMRPDQTFLCTEFSLVWHWKAHLSDPVSPQFAQRYGFPAGTLVWQVVKAAISDPFPQQQWNDFLASSPWYESQKHFLRDQMRLFRGTGRLSVATYGFRQDPLMVQNWGPDKNPWLFNSVMAPYTVQPWQNGDTGQSYAWIDDFRALQRGRGHIPPVARPAHR